MLTRALRSGLLLLAAYLAVCTALVATYSLPRADTGTPWTWLGVGLVLAELGLHGGLSLGSGSEPFATTSSGVQGTLIGLGLLVTVAAAVSARRSERSHPSASTQEVVLSSAISGVVAAAVLGLLGAAVHVDTEPFGLNGALELHGDGALVWGAAVLVVANACGRLRERGSLSLHGTALRFARSVGLALQHLVLSGVLLALAGIAYLSASSAHEVAAVSQATGSETSTVIGALVLLPNAAVLATGAFLGIGLGTGGQISSLGDVSTTVGLLHGDVPARHWLWVLCALVASLVIGTRRALRSDAGEAPLAGWLETTLAWAVAWVVLAQLVSVGSSGVSAGFTAPSVFVAPALWGLLTVAAGRVLAGPLAGALPRLDHRTTGGTASAVHTPLPPKVTASLVAIALVAVAGTAGYQVLARTRYSPAIVVQDYLDALERGDLPAALSHLRVEGARKALDPDGSRLTDGHVTSSDLSGDRASVEATFRVGGLETSRTFSLVGEGHRAGVFHRWVITNGTGQLQIGGTHDDLVVGGARVTSTALESTPLLPGGYHVTVAGKPWLTAGVDLVLVTPGGSEIASVDVSRAAKEQATTAVNDYLSQCLTTATSLTTSCGIQSYSSAAVTGVRWTLDGPPVLSFSYDTSSDLVRVSSTSGTARVTGRTATGPFTDTATPQVLGTVRFSSDGAVYTPGF